MRRGVEAEVEIEANDTLAKTETIPLKAKCSVLSRTQVLIFTPLPSNSKVIEARKAP